MKKTLINSGVYARIALFVCALVLTVSCSDRSSVEDYVEIRDDADLLSEKVENLISSTKYYGFPLVVATYDTLLVQDLDEFCNAQFDAIAAELGSSFKVNGVLVLASAVPNVAVAKFGSSVEEWNHGAPDYGSSDYFRIQMQEQNPEQKVLGVIDAAINYRIRESGLVSYLRGEAFGVLFTGLVKPDDGFLYRYIIYPCQWPFIQVLKLTKSVWLTMILVPLLLLLIARIVFNFVADPKRNLLKYNPKQPKLNKNKVEAASGCLFLLLYKIPVMVGALSIAISVGLNGVEHIQAIVEGMGLPLDVVARMFEGSWGQSSYVLTCIATLACWMTNYTSVDDAGDDVGGYLSSIATPALLFIILLVSPKAVSLVMAVFYIVPMLILKIYRNFWEDTYMHSRISGLSRFVSFFLAVLQPIAILAGVSAGFYFGSKTNEIFEFEDIEDITYTSVANVEQISDALYDWYDAVANR